MPRLADRPDPGVLRPGRRALAGEPVARVEAPQAGVSIDPAVLVRDDDRRPGLATRPDDVAVAAGIVDERHAERGPGALRQVAGVRLPKRVAPYAPEEPERSTEVALAGERQAHDVFAPLQVGRVRARTRVDHGVAVDQRQPRVVPTTTEVVPLLVVGRRAEPRGLDPPVIERLADHEALLPVGLVVVRAIERRPPVVHGVQEQVVEDDPATLPDHPAVVDHPRVGGPDRVVPDGGCGRGAAGDAAPEQQREHEAGVHQAGDEPHAREPPRREERLLAGAVAPPGELERAERLGHEPQELRLARQCGSPQRRATRGPGCRPGRRCGRRGGSALRAGRIARRTPTRPSGRRARPA